MALNSKIQWTDATWNVAIGCTKVSDGCKYCYMMRDFGEGSFKGGGRKDANGIQIPVNGTVTRTKPSTFNKPLMWQKQGLKCIDGSPLKVFVSSLTDVFHPEIDSYRNEIWDVIRKCPDLIFQILTKRPERIIDNLPEDWGDGYDNVWLGVTAENQEMAEKRIPLLSNFKCKIKFVSFEPLISEIDLSIKFDVLAGGGNSSIDGKLMKIGQIDFSYATFDWAIIGGESGNDTGKWRYRPSEINWYRKLIKDLSKNGVPVFFKQTGTYLSKRLKEEEGIVLNRHGSNIFDAHIPYDYNFLLKRDFPKAKITKFQ